MTTTFVSTTHALERYNRLFNATYYNTVGDLLASNLKTDRDSLHVADGLVLLQDVALELCGYSSLRGTYVKLAVYCGQNNVSRNTVDAMRDFLRLFNPDDTRIEDFEAAAQSMLLAHSGLDNIQHSAACANGIHSWQGRMAYELLAAAEYIIRCALILLAHDDETYAREKMRNGLSRITHALYEGVRHSATPKLWNLHGTHFPTEEDGTPRASQNNH